MTAWTSNAVCWWCRREENPVLWVGDARTAAGAFSAPLYACPPCLEDLEGRIREAAAACWWCGQEETPAPWAGDARIASGLSCTPVHICPPCLALVEGRIYQHVETRYRVRS